MDAADLPELLESWTLHLTARALSRHTIRTYGTGVRMYLAWCEAAGVAPTLSEKQVTEYVASLIAGGMEGSTAASRVTALKLFSAWLHKEGELDVDELAGMAKPKIHVQPLKPLDEEQLRALFAACQGTRFVDVRDAALTRLMAETAGRANDTLTMTVSGTNIRGGTATVIGKGHKPRILPFGPQTAVALDRYLRARKKHRLANTDTFWLGGGGKGFAYVALYKALMARAEAAGIEDFHPHRLRHTGATRWLAAGGSEVGLMAVAGWESLDMLKRYTEFTKQTRATDEAHRLNLGDL
jgi:site-specific recombinase XerD